MPELVEIPTLMHRPFDSIKRAELSKTVPENPIVQLRQLETRKYGISNENKTSPKYIDVEEITFPIYEKSGMYSIKAMRCDLDPYLTNGSESKSLEKDDRPLMTFVLIGGGGSTAIDNVHFLLKTAEGIRQYETSHEKFPIHVRAVLLPHIGGSAREIDTKDPTQKSTFSENARILEKAMKTKELGITESIGLIGTSSGGTQVTELAALLQDRCKFLALGDAAGMAEYPNLVFDFSIGQFVEAFKKFRGKGMSVKDSLKTGLNEIFNTTSTLYGNLKNVGDLLRDYIYPVRRSENAKAARAFGMEKTGAEVLPIKVLKHDSTKEARKNISAPIIFSPILYAKVVNTLFQRLKPKISGLETVSDIKAIRDSSEKAKKDFDQASLEVLKEMFPAVDKKNIHYTPYESNTHTSFSEQPFWDNLINTIAQTI